MTAVHCSECGAPFRWVGPGESGRVQSWYRQHEPGPRGDRCADRSACRARKVHPAMSHRQLDLDIKT